GADGAGGDDGRADGIDRESDAAVVERRSTGEGVGGGEDRVPARAGGRGGALVASTAGDHAGERLIVAGRVERLEQSRADATVVDDDRASEREAAGEPRGEHAAYAGAIILEGERAGAAANAVAGEVEID